MGPCARRATRGAALRVGLLLLLLLGQPGGLCAALCAFARPAASEHHRGHHASPSSGGPCHRLGDAASRVHELLDAIVLALPPVASAPRAPADPGHRIAALIPDPYPSFEAILDPPPPRA